MNYNVHNLTHLSKCVFLWGPLWANSCFPFEAANWQVKRHLNGNRGIIMQVMEKFLLLNTLPLFIEIPTVSSQIKVFCNVGTLSVLGCGQSRVCTLEERAAFQVLGHVVNMNEFICVYDTIFFKYSL